MVNVVRANGGNLLRQTLDNRGLKQNAIARKIGVSTAYFNQVLNGQTALSANVAIKASQVLDLPLDYFLGLS